jgi:hypothetical protein
MRARSSFIEAAPDTKSRFFARQTRFFLIALVLCGDRVSPAARGGMSVRRDTAGELGLADRAQLGGPAARYIDSHSKADGCGDVGPLPVSASR